jgi:hypothetical protein
MAQIDRDKLLDIYTRTMKVGDARQCERAADCCAAQQCGAQAAGVGAGYNSGTKCVHGSLSLAGGSPCAPLFPNPVTRLAAPIGMACRCMSRAQTRYPQKR